MIKVSIVGQGGSGVALGDDPPTAFLVDFKLGSPSVSPGMRDEDYDNLTVTENWTIAFVGTSSNVQSRYKSLVALFDDARDAWARWKLELPYGQDPIVVRVVNGIDSETWDSRIIVGKVTVADGATHNKYKTTISTATDAILVLHVSIVRVGYWEQTSFASATVTNPDYSGTYSYITMADYPSTHYNWVDVRTNSNTDVPSPMSVTLVRQNYSPTAIDIGFMLGTRKPYLSSDNNFVSSIVSGEIGYSLSTITRIADSRAADGYYLQADTNNFIQLGDFGHPLGALVWPSNFVNYAKGDTFRVLLNILDATAIAGDVLATAQIVANDTVIFEADPVTINGDVTDMGAYQFPLGNAHVSYQSATFAIGFRIKFTSTTGSTVTIKVSHLSFMPAVQSAIVTDSVRSLYGGERVTASFIYMFAPSAATSGAVSPTGVISGGKLYTNTGGHKTRLYVAPLASMAASERFRISVSYYPRRLSIL